MLQCTQVNHQSYGYQASAISGVCLDKQCQAQRLCCFKCLQEQHIKHSQNIVTFDNIDAWLQEQKQQVEQIIFQVLNYKQSLEERLGKIYSLMKIFSFIDKKELLSLNYSELNLKMKYLVQTVEVKNIIFDQSLCQQIEKSITLLDQTMIKLNKLLNIEDKSTKTVSESDKSQIKQDNVKINQETNITKEFYFNKGLELLIETKSQEAIKNFDLALKIDEQYQQAKLWKAYAFYLIGMFNESISLTKDIFKTDKNCYKAYLICGYSLLRLNDSFQAEIAFEKALKCFPLLKEVLIEQGIILLQKRAYKSAIDWFEKSFQLQENNPNRQALNGCIEAAQRMQRPDLLQKYQWMLEQLDKKLDKMNQYKI